MTAIQLEALEARVLGVLIEKELTTPESYPLSLNALVNGCNQKNNRDPLLSVGEREVNDVILKLRVAGLIEFVQQAGARVEKYRHKTGAALHLEAAEVAVLAELLLRGAQQPGELRARVERMQPMATQEALQFVLDSLARKGLAQRYDRRAGERAVRWGQLLAPEAGAGSPGSSTAGLGGAGSPSALAPSAQAPASMPSWPGGAPSAAGGNDSLIQRIAGLEGEVARLKDRIDQLEARGDRRSAE
ncbi:MAG: YceH family protein [Planctomycetota bacterium]